MSREGKTLAERVQRWSQVANNLRPDIGQYPQLEASLDDLERMEAEARALIAEIMTLQASLRTATSRLRLLARGGDMTRTRIGAGLRAAVGYDSPLLLRYGFRPRERHRLDEVRTPASAGEEAPADAEPDGEPGGSAPA
jgi:hypothetical protein